MTRLKPDSPVILKAGLAEVTDALEHAKAMERQSKQYAAGGNYVPALAMEVEGLKLVCRALARSYKDLYEVIMEESKGGKDGGNKDSQVQG